MVIFMLSVLGSLPSEATQSGDVSTVHWILHGWWSHRLYMGRKVLWLRDPLVGLGVPVVCDHDSGDRGLV